MTTWRAEVEAALRKLGGQGSLKDIYAQFAHDTQRKLTRNWQAIIRKELEDNSTDSKHHQGRHDIFYSVKGILLDYFSM